MGDLDRFFELSLDMLCVAGTDGYFKSLNPSFERVLGHSRDTLLASPFVDFVHPDDRHATLREVARLAEGDDAIFFANRYRCADGSYRRLEWIATASGGLIHAVARDVTDHHRLQDEVARFFELSTDLMAILDTSGRFCRVSPSCRATLGWTDTELLNRTLGDITAADDRADVAAALGRLDAENPTLAVDVQTTCADGSLRWIQWHGQLQPDTGTIYALGRDVGPQKQLGRLKDEFISTVSHELRTPLTSIRGALGLVAGGIAGQLPDQAAALLETARRNSERLSLLVNDILDMERIAAGRMELTLERCSLDELVRRAASANAAFAEVLGVRFQLDDVASETTVCADPVRLEQVLTNLLSNAAKFSPKGGEVRVRTEALDGLVRVEVTDQGPGVPAASQSDIFGRFRQATKGSSGSGLGLSIAKGLVEAMGGTIGLKSDGETGSTFWFQIPTVAEPGEQRPALATIQRPMRMLLAARDETVAKRMKDQIDLEGFELDIVTSAGEAEAMLAQRTYSAAVFDLLLPGRNGLALMRQLRERTGTRAMPVVLFSAEALEGSEEFEADAMVMGDWVRGPSESSRLTELIERVAEHAGRPRVLCVEDDEDLRTILAVQLEDMADLVMAPTLADAVEAARTLDFDLVVLDLRLPDGSGLDVIPIVRARRSETPIVIYSAYETDDLTAQQVAATMVKTRVDGMQFVETVRQLLTEGS